MLFNKRSRCCVAADSQHRFGSARQATVVAKGIAVAWLAGMASAAEVQDTELGEYRDSAVSQEQSLQTLGASTSDWPEWWFDVHALAVDDVASAQMFLAVVYRRVGPAHDPQRATFWLNRAAANGDPLALFELAEDSLLSTSLRPAERTQLYRRSADAGYVLAMLKIAQAFSIGDGVDANVNEALSWYRRAARTEAEAVQEWMLAHLHQPFAQLMPEVARRESVARASKSARTLHAKALFALFRAKQAHLDEHDEILLQRSARAGFNLAQYELAVVLLEKEQPSEQPLDLHDSDALQWMIKAADNGHASAQYELALYFQFGGKQPPLDPARAESLLRQSADAGFAIAQASLGCALVDGVFDEQYVDEGRRWLERAAAAGESSGAVCLNDAEHTSP